MMHPAERAELARQIANLCERAYQWGDARTTQEKEQTVLRYWHARAELVKWLNLHSGHNRDTLA